MKISKSWVIKHLPSARGSGLSLYHLILKDLTFYPYFKGEESLQGHMANKMEELVFKGSIPDPKFHTFSALLSWFS